MATRTKTIEYVFDVDTSDLATATRRDLSAITVYIPETVTAFRSVVAEIHCSSILAQNTTAVLAGIKLGAVAFSDTTITETLNASGETWTYKHLVDFTSYFTTNWSGTSMSCQVGLQYTGPTTRNHAVKLLITYEYDDTSETTRAKTIRIPIESDNEILTTSWEAVGGTTPIIDTSVIPENTVTIRQASLQFYGYTAVDGSTDFTVEYRINGGSAVEFYNVEAGTNNALSMTSFSDITSTITTTAYSLEAQTVGQVNRVANLGAVLTITYEYDHDNTTTVWNSLICELPNSEHSYLTNPGNASAQVAYGETEVWIPEPTTITLKESAAMIRHVTHGDYDLNVKIGSQASYLTYGNGVTPALDNDYKHIVHRFDSGGAGGAGVTLARGKNTIPVNVYTSNNNKVAGVTGYILLNYTSGKATDGADVHNHTVHNLIGEMVNATPVEPLNAGSTIAGVTIPESDYQITTFMPYGESRSLYPYINLAAEYIGSEGPAEDGSGMALIATWNGRPDLDYFTVMAIGQCITSGVVMRWSGDADGTRLDPEGSRRWYLSQLHNQGAQAGCWTTYHAITWTASGTASGYAGDGSGITVELYDSDTNELLKTTTTATGGTFSFTWHDDTRNLMCVAREDATHVGRSDNGNAS